MTATTPWPSRQTIWGSCEQARRGLLRALHDIGVWSSMGAVHTSTIRLYHQFADRDARPELLMHAFFHPDAGYPGTVHLWDTEATATSDWGWSGLRDLGDLEFYPFIRTYVEAADAEWTVTRLCPAGVLYQCHCPEYFCQPAPLHAALPHCRSALPL